MSEELYNFLRIIKNVVRQCFTMSLYKNEKSIPAWNVRTIRSADDWSE